MDPDSNRSGFRACYHLTYHVNVFPAEDLFRISVIGILAAALEKIQAVDIEQCCGNLTPSIISIRDERLQPTPFPLRGGRWSRFRFIWDFDGGESWRAGVSASLVAGFRFLDWMGGGGVVICGSFHFDLSQSLGWDGALEAEQIWTGGNVCERVQV